MLRLFNSFAVSFFIFLLFPAGFIFSEENTLFLTIQDAVQRGLASNFEYKKTILKNKIYDELIKEYWREYYPKVGIGISKDEEIVLKGQDTLKNTINFSLEQMIYDGGKISQAKELALIEKKINLYDNRDMENVIKQTVVDSFFKILALYKKKTLQEEFLFNIQEQVKIAKEELNLGEITRLDLLEIETKWEEEKYQLKKIELDIKIEKSNLKKILKVEAQKEIALKSLFFEKFSKMKHIKDFYRFEDLLGIAFSKKKEFAKNILEYKKAKQEFELLDRSYIPTISLVGNYSLTGESLPRDKSYSIGIVFNFTIGGSPMKTTYNEGSSQNGRAGVSNMGANISILENISVWGSQYLEKQLKISEVLSQNEDMKRQLEIELKTLYENIEDIIQSYEIQERKMALIDERLKLSKLKLELGEMKRLDVVDIQIEKLKIGLELVNTIFTYVSSAIKLEAGIGVPIGFFKMYDMDIE
ncbi:MAG TPA: hypothetical protein DHW82_13715 [Spirochaetia bacterium]|nr:MAG: hypothetical protein A2Y41_09310 [Spirochaetes bacterium GWB1_36_13]HCL58047.1 hypothetical protein [Spirochaetia bacterium]